MERSTIFKFGKPSISMGHLYHGYVSHNQMVTQLKRPSVATFGTCRRRRNSRESGRRSHERIIPCPYGKQSDGPTFFWRIWAPRGPQNCSSCVVLTCCIGIVIYVFFWDQPAMSMFQLLMVGCGGGIPTSYEFWGCVRFPICSLRKSWGTLNFTVALLGLLLKGNPRLKYQKFCKFSLRYSPFLNASRMP